MASGAREAVLKELSIPKAPRLAQGALFRPARRRVCAFAAWQAFRQPTAITVAPCLAVDTVVRASASNVAACTPVWCVSKVVRGAATAATSCAAPAHLVGTVCSCAALGSQRSDPAGTTDSSPGGDVARGGEVSATTPTTITLSTGRGIGVTYGAW